MSNQVAVRNVNDIVLQQERVFNDVCADNKILFAKESQFAMQLLQANEFLNKIAWANQSSLQNAIINVASVGISLNPATKHAYLVPRKGVVCLDISYMGLIHLAQSAGSITWAQCKLVRASDTYSNRGLDKSPDHSYNAFATDDKRGAIVGGYCTVKLPDGDFLTHEMNLEAIKKIQSLSSAGQKGPWKDHWDEMARKTIVKQSSKYWPRVDRLDNAIHMLNTDADEGLDAIKDVTPQTIDNPIDELMKLIEGKPVEKVLKWLKVESFDQLSTEAATRAVIAIRNSKQ